MAVYTHLSRNEIADFLSCYDIGELQDFSGITEGVSNSNYLLVTANKTADETSESANKYILTLFERRYQLEELPYFVALMQWWRANGINCPLPLTMKNGRVLSALKERPALLVSFLEGAGVEARRITAEHLFQLGAIAARTHISGIDFPHQRKNGLSLSAWENMIDKLYEKADSIAPELHKTISREYNYLSDNWPDALPSGPIHADLFPDNVFFDCNKKLSGIIDCYFACNDFWAYDLAIIINAWCFDERQRFIPDRATALMQGYNELRSLTVEEEAALPVLLRGASLRFLLTRSIDWLETEEGAAVNRKNPLEYLSKLQFFQNYKT